MIAGWFRQSIVYTEGEYGVRRVRAMLFCWSSGDESDVGGGAQSLILPLCTHRNCPARAA